MDQYTYRIVGGHDEEDTDGNIQEENGRNNMKLERKNKELARVR